MNKENEIRMQKIYIHVYLEKKKRKRKNEREKYTRTQKWTGVDVEKRLEKAKNSNGEN